jgi:hypothetical protein
MLYVREIVGSRESKDERHQAETWDDLFANWSWDENKVHANISMQVDVLNPGPIDDLRLPAHLPLNGFNSNEW